MKKQFRRIVAAMLTTTMAVTIMLPNIVQVAGASESTEDVLETEEYLIVAKNDEALSNISEEYDNLLENVLADTEQIEAENMAVVELTANEAKELNKDTDTLYVEKDIPMYGMSEKKEKTATEDEVSFEEIQWNLDAVHLDENKAGEEKIKVAVLDSGVSFSSDIELAGSDVICESDEGVNPLFADSTGHGTAIAGIIGAKADDEGITGICPEADIYSIKILDNNNQTSLSVAVNGIYKAIENDCNIINMSFGTTVDSKILHKAVKDAYDAGILLVAAAGNSEGRVMYPAAYDEVMAVGSTDENGRWIETTAKDENLEILAPGTKIPATDSLFGVSVTEGTSMATAHVSAAAALIWSKDKTKSADYIRRLLTNTAQNVENVENTAGLLDIGNSVKQMDTFSQIYKEGVVEYKEMETTVEDAQICDDKGLINGLWSNKENVEYGHVSIAQNAYLGTGISAESQRIIKKATSKPDDDGFNEARLFHGSYNYMKTLHFVYAAAETFRKMYKQPEKNTQYKGKTLDTVIDAVIKKAVTDSSFVGTSTGEKQQILYAKAQYKNMLNAILKDKEATGLTGTLYYSTDNARRCYYATAGIGMHLIGDVYAHRTMVPLYTVEDENPKKSTFDSKIGQKKSRFGSYDFSYVKGHTTAKSGMLITWAANSKAYAADKRIDSHKKDKICGNWSCFQKSVKLGIIEFRDIQHYMVKIGFTYEIKGEKIRSKTQLFEDNAFFCSERYVDAETNCQLFFNDLQTAEKYDGIKIMFPTYESLKLNNFKTCSYKSKESDYANITSAEWEKWSKDGGSENEE